MAGAENKIENNQVDQGYDKDCQHNHANDITIATDEESNSALHRRFSLCLRNVPGDAGLQILNQDIEHVPIAGTLWRGPGQPDAEILRRLGVDYLQGYYFGVPAAAPVWSRMAS